MSAAAKVSEYDGLLRDINAAIGDHLKRLEALGLVHRDRLKSRSTRLTAAGEAEITAVSTGRAGTVRPRRGLARRSQPATSSRRGGVRQAMGKGMRKGKKKDGKDGTKPQAKKQEPAPGLKPSPHLLHGTERLPVKLTYAEVQERGRQAMDLFGALESVDLEKKEASAGFNARKKGILRQIHDLQPVIANGAEDRDVATWSRPDLANRLLRTVRVDTFEEIRTRKLTDDELQQPLPLDAKPGKPAKKERKKKPLPGDPTPENLEQLRSAGAYYGRSDRERVGKRFDWEEGMWPAPELWEQMGEVCDRDLTEVEQEVAVKAYRAEACDPLPEGATDPAATPPEAQSPADPTPEEMQRRLNEARAIGRQHGKSSLRVLGGMRLGPDADRTAWPAEGFWDSIGAEVGHAFTEAEREACVEGYFEELCEPADEPAEEPEHRNGEAKRRPRKGDQGEAAPPH